MRATLRCEAGLVDLIALEAGIDERRSLGPKDAGRFADWQATWRALREKDDAQAELLALGRAIAGWLDGSERWLTRLLRSPQPPLIVEFQALDHQDETAQAFLQAPWELIANKNGHLAADVILRYAPLRRLGPGRDPPSPDVLCLGLTFMAATPRGPHDILDYEGEENAILDAVGTLPIDLVVEESGNPALLAERLAEEEAMQVLHLSCHGHSEPEPVLLLEDEEGGPLPTGAAALIEALGSHLPRLAFVSACLSAAAGSLADPLAMTLVRAGVPAVLGWDGSVDDRQAIRFAHELYIRLAARRQSVEDAVAGARRELLNAQAPEERGDWHLARLWLGPTGGGILVGGKRQRHKRGKDHGHTQILDRHGERPVASRQAFVGRRRQVQEGLKVLREGTSAGLLIHGMGRLGKSSLAARLAHRRADLALVVIFGHYDAVTIADEIRDVCPAARDLVDAARARLRDTPEALEDLLRDLLKGPCAQADGETPILLFIDDLEQILETPPEAGPWRVQPAFQPVMKAVLRAFDRAQTDSRLLLTSRYTFTLRDGAVDLAERLHHLHLPPMDMAGQRKQALRRLQGQDAADEEHQRLLDRCVEIAQGSPGLQDLLFGLVLEDPQAAEAALTAMETYLQQGELPEQEAAGNEVRDFLEEDLALSSLLALAGDSGQALLRAASLFHLPAPRPAMTALAKAVGGDPDRLLALGLMDRFEDLVEPPDPAFMVNALVAPKAGTVTEKEMKAWAAEVLDALFAAWGGEDSRGRPYGADMELTRLALLCRHAKVISVCAPNALDLLVWQSGYPLAAAWGEQALAILDAARIAPSIGLLRRAGEACVMTGETKAAGRYYARAVKRIKNRLGEESGIDPREHAALLLAQGRLLAQQGKTDTARRLFNQCLSICRENKYDHEAAAVLGELADILFAHGELEKALCIRREEQIPIYERLGENSGKAVSMGQIVDILFRRGELDEAEDTLREILPVYERHGNVRAKAIAMGKLAAIFSQRGELDAAEGILRETLSVYERLGDAREKAVTLSQIADILFQRGEIDEALRSLRETLSVYERLGDVRARAVTMSLIADILYERGELDAAERTWWEILSVYEQLGDAREKALTLWNLSRIATDRWNFEMTKTLLAESYQINERIGHAEGIAFVGQAFGQLLVMAEEQETGLAVLRRSEEAFRKLGQDTKADRIAEFIAAIAAASAEGEGTEGSS